MGKRIFLIFFSFAFVFPFLASSAEKVVLCHDPSGPDRKTIELAADDDALSAHLDHGDTLGACAPIVTNHPPVFEAIAPITVNAGEQVQFVVRANDEDGDLLVYSATGTPTGATFDPLTRAFAWKPNAASVGSHTIAFHVADGAGIDSEDTMSVEITVRLATPACGVNELFGSYYNLPDDHPDMEGVITGVVTGTTPFERDWFSERHLSFTRNDPAASLKTNSDYFPVNDGFPGDPFYFAVHWQGSFYAASSGSYVATLASDDDSWLYVNGAQKLDIGGIHPLAQATTTLALSAGTSTIDIYFAERHRAQSGLFFEISGADNAPIVFSGCPSMPTPPSAENRPPVFTGPTTASTTVSSTLEFTVAASDPDNDPIAFSYELPLGATYATSSGLFEWTPSAVGTSTARFFASDGNATSTHEVLLEVFAQGGEGVNLPPSFVNFSPPSTATATERYAYDVHATDPEHDPLVFTPLVSPGGMSIASTTGLIEWTPDSAQATTTPYTVTVEVSDGRNATSTSYAIVVSQKSNTEDTNDDEDDIPGSTGGGGSFEVPGNYPGGGGGGGAYLGGGTPTSTQNQPPYFVNFSPGADATSTWLYLYDVEAADPENDPLNYSLLAAPQGMSILSTTGFIFWVPTPEQAAAVPYIVTVQVSDGTSATSTSYAITVSAPAINSAPLQQIQFTNQEPSLGIGGQIETPSNLKATSIQSTSTETSGTASAESRPFGVLLLAGILNYFGNFLNWITAYWCVIGYLLWLLTVIAFMVYAIANRRKDKPEEISKEAPEPFLMEDGGTGSIENVAADFRGESGFRSWIADSE